MSKATAIIAFISNELSMLYFLYNIIQRERKKRKRTQKSENGICGWIKFSLSRVTKERRIYNLGLMGVGFFHSAFLF